MIVLAVAAAGALGTLARYGLDQVLRRRWPARPTGPILLVNAAGSLVLGVLVGLVAFHGAPTAVRTIAGTGFCASFTTFSTACWETLTLLRDRRLRAAAGHATATLLATTAAAALGLALAAA